jgi:hypothetical protein
MRKEAARYASQPSPGFMSGQPGYADMNRFGRLFGLGPNSLSQAAQAGHLNPNAAKNLSVPTHALATPEGIQQAAQKVAEFSYAHFGARANRLSGAEVAPGTLFKNADVSAGAGNVGAASSSASNQDAGRYREGATRAPSGRGGAPAAQNAMTGFVGNNFMGVQRGNPLAAAVRAGWAGLSPGSPTPVPNVMNQATLDARKSAAQKSAAFNTATGGCDNYLDVGQHGYEPRHFSFPSPALANSPFAEKRGMIVPGPAGMPPQGAAVQAQPPGPPGMPQGPGAAPPPGAPPPAGAGAMPPPVPGQPQGGGGAPQGRPPQPVPPPTAPMTDMPPTPLPANPRPMPPQPKTSDNAMQQAVMLRLMEDKQHADRSALPQQANDDMQSQLFASDVKMAEFYLKKLGAHATHGRDDDYSMHRKWEWDALNQAVARGHHNWLPRVFTSKKTPITDTLSSPGKGALLGGLLGAGLGGLAGGVGGHVGGMNPWVTGAAGALGGGALGGIHTYAKRQRDDDEIMDSLRKLPPGSTLGDLKTLDKEGGLLNSTIEKSALLGPPMPMTTQQHQHLPSRQPQQGPTPGPQRPRPAPQPLPPTPMPAADPHAQALMRQLQSRMPLQGTREAAMLALLRQTQGGQHQMNSGEAAALNTIGSSKTGLDKSAFPSLGGVFRGLGRVFGRAAPAAEEALGHMHPPAAVPLGRLAQQGEAPLARWLPHGVTPVGEALDRSAQGALHTAPPLPSGFGPHAPNPVFGLDTAAPRARLKVPYGRPVAPPPVGQPNPVWAEFQAAKQPGFNLDATQAAARQAESQAMPGYGTPRGRAVGLSGPGGGFGGPVPDVEKAFVGRNPLLPPQQGTALHQTPGFAPPSQFPPSASPNDVFAAHLKYHQQVGTPVHLALGQAQEAVRAHIAAGEGQLNNAFVGRNPLLPKLGRDLNSTIEKSAAYRPLTGSPEFVSFFEGVHRHYLDRLLPAKYAAQDNSKPQRSATGESEGLTFQHKPDHYMQGQDAWASADQYFKRRPRTPNPFTGRHSGEKSATIDTKDLLSRALSNMALRPGGLVDRARSALGQTAMSMPTHRDIKLPLQTPPTPPPELAPPSSSLSQMALPAGLGAAGGLGMGALLGRIRARGKHTKPKADGEEKDASYGALEKSAWSPMPAIKSVASWGARKLPSVFGEVAAHPNSGVEEALGHAAGQVGKGLERAAPEVASAAPHWSPRAMPGLSMGDFYHTGPQQGGGMAARFGRAVLPQVGPTLGGAALGGWAGDDLGLGGGHTDLPLGFHLSNRGMLAGAAAFNPYLRRLAMGRGELGAMGQAGRFGLNPAMSGFRHAAVGAFGGQMADALAGSWGYDTQGRFGRMGALGGMGLGTVRGLGQAGMRQWGPRALSTPALDAAGNMVRDAAGRVMVNTERQAGRPGLYNASRWMNLGGRGGIKPLGNFGHGAGEGFMNTLTYLPRKGMEMVAGTPSEGGLRHTLFGMTPGESAGLFGGKRPGVMQGLGRLAGVGVVAGTGVGMGSALAQSKFNNAAREAASNVYNEGMPLAQEDMANFMDRYMQSRGMTDESGQFNPMAGVGRGAGGMMSGVMRGADSILRSLGMRPETMTVPQKIAILGGGAAAGYGALSGSPAVAGGGGLALLGGLLPSLMPGQSQGGRPGMVAYNQPNPAQGVLGSAGPYSMPLQWQNEWQRQRQLNRPTQQG